MIDEVIAVGDEEFQRRCFDHLYKLRRQGVTIVMVSHGRAVMEQMCDEVAWLDHGRLHGQGRPVRGRAQVPREGQRRRERAAVERRREVPVADDDEVVVDTGVRRGGQPRDRDHRLRAPRRSRRAAPAGSTGDPLTVRIRYRAARPVSRAGVRARVQHRFGRAGRGAEHVVRRGLRRDRSTAKATSTSSSTVWR